MFPQTVTTGKSEWSSNNMLPKDPVMLLSMINMKLRDQYSNLDALCDDMDEDREEIIKTLAGAGYNYDPEPNQFK